MTFRRSVPRQYHERTFAHQLSGCRRREQVFQQLRDPLRRVGDALRRDRPVVLFREVDVVGDQGFQADQLVAQRHHASRQSTIQLTHGHALCRSRVGVHQIARRLRLQDVELSVQYRASRELPRQGEPSAVREERAEYRGRDDESAVGDDLDRVFAGERRRRIVAHGERLVDLDAARVEDWRQHGHARFLWKALDRRGGDLVRARSGHTDDRERPSAGGRRDRGYGIRKLERARQRAVSAASARAILRAR